MPETARGVLDRRALTCATADRQWLGARRPAAAADALTHLVGLQAQEPLEPYVGLWSRTIDFRPGDLVEPLEQRQAVRTTSMRRTLHLHTRADALRLRPVVEPMLRGRMLSTLRARLDGVDPDQLAEVGRPGFTEQPRRLNDVAREVADLFPGVEARDLGDALSSLLPLVQVPPRGVWGQTAPALSTTFEAWLGSDPETLLPGAEAHTAAVAGVVRDYLRAFGPAAGADIRAWSGLTGLPAVITSMADELRTYRDERGRVLLDLAELELPDPDAVLRPRFLPAFDNAVLGYDDRSRVIDDDHRWRSTTGARYVLVDGRVAGVWTSSRSGTAEAGAGAGAGVTVEPLRRWTREERQAVAEEADALATFLGDGAPGRVRWA